MTLPEILNRVCERRKIARNTLYTYFKELGIQRVGRRQRPAQYPDDAADKVLKHLGLPYVVTMPEMRHARRNSRRGTR